jgi:UrcA family protein
MLKLLASAAVLTAATLTASTATAQDTRSVEVRYDDLNLESAAGQARLETRIGSAVRSVCGAANGPQSLSQRAAILACTRTAREKATTEVASRISQNTRLGG